MNRMQYFSILLTWYVVNGIISFLCESIINTTFIFIIIIIIIIIIMHQL